jgi:ATP-dependent Clp protease ATP-binding subunit ClpB
MDVGKFTQMAQEALSSSQLISGEYGHQQIDSEHLFASLLRQENGVVPSIIKRLGLDVHTVIHEVENALAK